MTVFAFASVKASPGVTTTVIALASAWPTEERPLVIEADASGGVLAPRFGLATEPGLVSAAAAAFRGASGRDLTRHAQALCGDLLAVAGPASPEQAHGALGYSGPLARAVNDLGSEEDVLIDLGRLHPGSPALALAHAADVMTFMCRPRLDEVHHLVHAVPSFAPDLTAAALAVLGQRPYPPAEVAEAVGLPLAGVVPVDPPAAEALRTGTGSPRVLRHSLLLRAARELADTLRALAPQDRLARTATEETQPAPEPSPETQP